MRKNQGFSLIEMAIVLVIIGLIIGVLLVANNALGNARLRAVMSETQDYRKAFGLFRDKYNGLPGDFYNGAGSASNATVLWGTDAACPNTPVNTVPKTATCDGNGDNHITGLETHRAWQQLADAGFIKGKFTGVPINNASTDSSRLGLNIPASGADGIGYYVYYHSAGSTLMTTWTSATSPAPPPFGHYMDIAMIDSANNQVPDAPAFSPADAASIDTKMDDGQPGTGSVLATGAGCAASATAYTGTTNTTPQCVLSVALGLNQ